MAIYNSCSKDQVLDREKLFEQLAAFLAKMVMDSIPPEQHRQMIDEAIKKAFSDERSLP